MKLTITTLVIIEDTSDNCNELNLCYHSFQEDPNRAKSEIIAAVNGVYAPDRYSTPLRKSKNTSNMFTLNPKR